MSKNIHVGDIGTLFKVRIIDDILGTAIDISAATTKKIIFVKRDKSRVEFAADFTTNGSDGYIEYSTQSGDLDQAGSWRIQGKTIGPTYTNSSEVDSFLVLKNL